MIFVMRVFEHEPNELFFHYRSINGSLVVIPSGVAPLKWTLKISYFRVEKKKIKQLENGLRVWL